MGHYLSLEQLKAYLRLGKAVEQWLDVVNYADYSVIRWLSINQEYDTSYTVTCFEMFDDGNDDFIDVYAFSPLDPDKPYGKSQIFKTEADALEHCLMKFRASPNRFVTAGMIQKEYESHRL